MSVIFTTMNRPVTEFGTQTGEPATSVVEVKQLAQNTKAALEQFSEMPIGTDTELDAAKQVVFDDFKQSAMSLGTVVEVPVGAGTPVAPDELSALQTEVDTAKAALDRLETAKTMCNVYGVDINCGLCATLNGDVSLLTDLTDRFNAATSELLFATNWQQALLSEDAAFIRSLAICLQNIANTRLVGIMLDAHTFAARGKIDMTDALVTAAMTRGGAFDADLLIGQLISSSDGSLGDNDNLSTLAIRLGYSPSNSYSRVLPGTTSMRAVDLDRSGHLFDASADHGLADQLVGLSNRKLVTATKTAMLL